MTSFIKFSLVIIIILKCSNIYAQCNIERFEPNEEIWGIYSNDDNRYGAGIYKHLHDDDVYLMVIDLRCMEMDVLLGDVQDMFYDSSGNYYPSSLSPKFKRTKYDDIQSTYAKMYGKKYFGMINGIPFEPGCSNAEIAYPIKVGKEIATGGGSSGFGGPDVALVLNNLNDAVLITSYNTFSGSPLNSTFYADGYAYWGPDRVTAITRTSITGSLDYNNDGPNETLLILVVDKDINSENAARYLTDLGVLQTHMIVQDGGASTFLAGQNGIVTPSIAPDCITTVRRPNNYLGFREKGQTSEDLTIAIQNPHGGDELNTGDAYLILWRDNIEDEVQIQLYKDESYLQTLAYSTESDGVFKWIPSAALESDNDYQIKILYSSLTKYAEDITKEFEIINTDNNLIVNGDFESGNTGFTSDYTHIASCASGNYLITSNPVNLCGGFSTCSDHTPSPGTLMMVVNGSTQSNQTVWQQTVNVITNSEYEFKVHATNVEDVGALPQLRFFINSSQVGQLNLSSTNCNWEDETFTWNSGPSTSATLRIVDVNTASNGNDFALDDLSFVRVFNKISADGIDDQDDDAMKNLSFKVQNFPNPFNPSTVITFTLPETDYVRLIIFDILGREVSELVNEQKNAGEYSVTFDASSLPSGTYIYRLETTRNAKTDKMLLLK